LYRHTSNGVAAVRGKTSFALEQCPIQPSAAEWFPLELVAFEQCVSSSKCLSPEPDSIKRFTHFVFRVIERSQPIVDITFAPRP